MDPISKRIMRIKAAISLPETGPTMRRFFINTMFDSIFVLLGVVIGSALSPDPDLDVILATILTSSVALGISTGVSVYEAESIEQERRIEEMERALLISLEDTDLMKASKTSLLLISLTNLSAPIISCAVILLPFLLFPDGEIRTTAYIAVGLAISMLFVTGAVMGRFGGRNPWLKGTRMAVIGFFAFVLCFWIESLV